MNTRLLPAAFVALSTLAPLLAQNATPEPASVRKARGLQPGTPVPELHVAEWVKGEAVTKFEKGKVYVVEFWAVWCGPCLGNIPHLTELQKKYGKDGLVIIGMTSPDTAKDTGHGAKNTLATVKDFVARRGDRMNYRVAFDQAKRETFWDFFGAENAGIPAAFVFDREGKLAARGHPFFLDYVIRDVLAGTWDPEKGPVRQRRLQELTQRDDKNADYATFKAHRAEFRQEFPEMADKTINTELLRAILEDDAETVQSVGAVMEKRALEDGELNDLGFTINQILRREPYAAKAKPYLELAGHMTEAFVTATNSVDPTALGLRAEWFAAKGDLNAAVEWQKKAVAAEIEGRRDPLQQRLEELDKQLADKSK